MPARDRAPVTITVNGGACHDFRWTVEEDQMFEVIPGAPGWTTPPSVNFHKSYMPVVRRRDADDAGRPALDPSQALLRLGAAEGRAVHERRRVDRAGQTASTVKVNTRPMPTAQVRVRVVQGQRAAERDVGHRRESALPASRSPSRTPAAATACRRPAAHGRVRQPHRHRLCAVHGRPAPCDSYEVLTYGKGFVLTDADGYALIENLAPGKYGVKVIPPAGEAWQQTATIEGKQGHRRVGQGQRAARYFAEFGPAGTPRRHRLRAGRPTS